MAKYFDENGNEVEALTPEEALAQAEAKANEAVAAEAARLKAEHDKIIADKDAHQAEKLKQLEEARGGVDKDKEAVKAMAEEAKRIADEAKAAIAVSEAEKIALKKDYWIRSVVGNDADLIKRINENYELLNMPSGTDAEISARVQKAVQAAGIGAVNHGGGGVSFGGGMPPSAAPINETQKTQAYETWKNELGLQDFIPKPPAKQ